MLSRSAAGLHQTLNSVDALEDPVVPPVEDVYPHDVSHIIERVANPAVDGYQVRDDDKALPLLISQVPTFFDDPGHVSVILKNYRERILFISL